MKKAIAFLLFCILLLSYCMPLLYASDTESEIMVESPPPLYETLRENSVTYACQYHQNDGRIVIEGNVNHDIMVTHKDYLIEVYSILPGQTFDQVIGDEAVTPLASTAIAVKFEFSIPAKRVLERFSKYAIVLRSPEGKGILAAEPKLAGVESAYEYAEGDRSAWKGVKTTLTSIGGDLGFGTAIVEVDLNRLLNPASSGYLYPVEQSYCYFDKTYINELDARIRTYSATGARVYLQFLLPVGESALSTLNTEGSGASYAMPNVYDEATLRLLCAFSEFLASRYEEYQSGLISGIIVGTQIDNRGINDCGSLSLEQYAEMYALYLTVVANSARLYHADLDIVIPFGNTDSYSNQFFIENENGNYTASALLESVLSNLDDSLSFGFQCSTLIESPLAPLGLTNETLASLSNKNDWIPEGELVAENLNEYSAYLTSLAERYQSAPAHYMYVWNVAEGLDGNALACAYAYGYYRLFEDPLLASFVVSFSDLEQAGSNVMSDIKKILQYIDTDRSSDVTNNLLPYFGASDWKEVLGEWSEASLAIRRVDRITTGNLSDREWTGSFSYFDFSSGDIRDWFQGVFCGNLKSDYGANGVRSLRADFQATQGAEHADLFCLYQYPENFVYTPFMKFTFSLTSETEASDALFEIQITVGNDQNRLIGEYIVGANESIQLLMDMSAYSESNLANYMKISVRMITGEAKEYSLWLQNITGYSTVYSSEELSARIEEERLRIRNQSDASDDNDGKTNLVWIIFGVLLSVTAVGTGIFMAFKRNEESIRGDDSKETDKNRLDE